MKNVNELKLIQIGITVADERGRTPSPTSTWQFNMHFDLSLDKHNSESIDMLKKAGLDFDKHAKIGISHELFAQYLKTSGLVENDRLTWVAFNSSFDFAYMVKLLEGGDDNLELPTCKYEFLRKCNQYFPNFYDVKQLEISTGSLAEQAIKSDIKWEGNSHQAGSDSLVTMKLFSSKGKEFFCRHSMSSNRKYNLKSMAKNLIYKFDHYSNSDDETLNDNQNHFRSFRSYRNGFQNFQGGRQNFAR